MKKVGYQGIAGAFSHQACVKFLPDYAPQAFEWFDSLCAALAARKLDAAVIPVENIITGGVEPAIDALSRHEFPSSQEEWMPIIHCWLTKKNAGHNKIKNIFSHYQALRQCSVFIETHNLTAKEMFDTAGAAEWLSRNGVLEDSVIASELAADLYGLTIAEKNIANRKDNKTKFRIIVL